VISSFFPSGLARRGRAKPEGKKEIGLGFTQGGGQGGLALATIRPPLRGSGEANQTRPPTPVESQFALPAPVARRGCAVRWAELLPFGIL
jgi:hypothetical protein